MVFIHGLYCPTVKTNCLICVYNVMIIISVLNLRLFHLPSVRVSNELGQGHPVATKYSVYVTVVQSLLLGLLSMVIILITKDDFAVIYTNSTEMRAAVAKLAYLLGITMVLNSVQPVISGTIPIYHALRVYTTLIRFSFFNFFPGFFQALLLELVGKRW